MSKSLGNVVLVKDYPYSKMSLRLLLLSTQYRSPINYTEQSSRMFAEDWDKIEATLNAIYRKIDLAGYAKDAPYTSDQDTAKAVKAFAEAMENDFNTPNAITELQALVKIANTEIRKGKDIARLSAILSGMNYMLGILGLKTKIKRLTEADRELIRKWEKHRQDKQFTEADKLRVVLQEKGLL